jgi:hypothetical protein
VQSDSSIVSLKTGKTIENTDAKLVAQMLQKNNVLGDVKVSFISGKEGWTELAVKMLGKKASNEEVAAKVLELSSLAGKYDPYTNTVFIREDLRNSPSLALHEITHAKIGGVIETVLSDNKKAIQAAKIKPEQVAAVENLKTLYAHIDDVMRTREGDTYTALKGEGDYYGFSNVHEMVSEALTNGAFQNVLKNIEVPKEVLAELKLTDTSLVGKIKNAWDALVVKLMDVLGVSKDTSLAHILEQATRLANSIDKPQQDMVAMLKSQGLSMKEIKSLRVGGV